MDIVIRNETESDIKTISEITKAAFDTLAISRHTEQFIINALRDANVLSVSLAAVSGNRLVGHIAFSPVTITDGSPGWYGLGPISVLPELQKQGIGNIPDAGGTGQVKVNGGKGLHPCGRPCILRAVRLQKPQGPDN